MKNSTDLTSARDGDNESLWQGSHPRLEIKPLKVNTIYDVVIIGGGITGVTTALELQRKGKKCILIEAQNLGFGTTGGTSAHLNTFLDATYPEIDSDFGKEASAQLARATREIIEMIHSNIEALEIDADFEYKDAFLFSKNQEETKQLKSILSSSQQAGVEVSEVFENGIPIDFQHVLLFKEQAQFHPIKYILGLARELLKLGGDVLEHTFVENSEYKDDIHYINAGNITVQGRHLVWATHIPPGINILSLRNAPYRSYVLAAKLKSGDYPNCLAYDMQEPYHYFRSHKIDGDQYLLIGGADHKTGHDDPEKAFSALEKYTMENFDISSIDYRWSSQYYVPVDGLPYIGQFPGGDANSFVATGFNGNGMIFGSLSAMILTDLILGIENDLAKLLSPSRLKPISGFTDFVQENADVAYHFVADRFGTEIIKSTKELKNDEGKIVELEGKKLALYKDINGKTIALSPVCTHAGCIVNWNASEKSWDCPCHGGRFATDGKVLTGPPRKALERIEIHKTGQA